MDAALNRIQLYSENSSIKYPLDDQHTEAIANDILLDLSLSVPSDAGIITCTNMVIKPSFIFISLECATYPIGHVMVTNPIPFIIYPLTMSCDGSGWVVFGPGVSREFTIRGSTAAIDKRTILYNVDTAKKFKLSVNGFEYDMPPILNIAVNTNLTSTSETRTIAGIGSATSLVLKRDDTKFTDAMLKTGLIVYDPRDIPLATINSIFPDAASGNVDLVINTDDPTEEVFVVPMKKYDGTAMGLVIFTRNMLGCPDAYETLDGKIKKSDTGYGLAYRLPLDCMFDDPESSSDSFVYPCPEGY